MFMCWLLAAPTLGWFDEAPTAPVFAYKIELSFCSTVFLYVDAQSRIVPLILCTCTRALALLHLSCVFCVWMHRALVLVLCIMCQQVRK